MDREGFARSIEKDFDRDEFYGDEASIRNTYTALLLSSQLHPELLEALILVLRSRVEFWRGDPEYAPLYVGLLARAEEVYQRRDRKE